MATKADRFRFCALHEAGALPDPHHHPESDYDMGAEGVPQTIEGEQDYDCSGYGFRCYRFAGVSDFPRLTANHYKDMATPIKAPSKVGRDFAVRLNESGHAEHIVWYIGHGQTAEARGRIPDMEVSTVAKINARGLKWYRFRDAKYDLGALTPPAAPKPQPAGPAYPGHPLTLGMEDSAVAVMQRRLNVLGFRDYEGKKLEDDAKFGRRTAYAVVAFKRRHGLLARSYVGPKTWYALFH